MKQKFFSLSDRCFKYRRNFLFLALLFIFHLAFIPVQSWFDFVELVDKAYIDLALLLVLIWFAVNYFYYLYTEYTEWKSGQLTADDLHQGIQANIWHSYTLVPEIQVLTQDKVIVRAELSSSKTIFDKSNKSEDDLSRDMIDVMEIVEEEIKTGMKSDIARIGAFQNAVKRYNAVHRFRFYGLDIFIPVFMLIVVVGLLGLKYFL